MPEKLTFFSSDVRFVEPIELQMLKLPQEAKQKAWNYLNDSQRFRSYFLRVISSSAISLISPLPSVCTQNGCGIAVQVRGSIHDMFSAPHLPIHSLAYTLKLFDWQAAVPVLELNS